MAFELSSVVPWGRSLSEYVDMFALSTSDLNQRILGCADGPASFNAELTARGGAIVSTDPLYQFSRGQIDTRIKEISETITNQLSENRDSFLWHRFSSPEHLRDERLLTMKRFLSDYIEGVGQGRYSNASLPSLPFENGDFNLALCSHFLFLYGSHLSLEFHMRSVLELCRVADEVRIFPLLELDNKPSQYIKPIAEKIRALGGFFEIEEVSYEFQKGANHMARIRC